MSFDEWWSSYWDPLSGPEVTNLMFKEVAQNAWYAAQVEALTALVENQGCGGSVTEEEFVNVQNWVNRVIANLGESS
jgi:hypothetical protein